MAREKMPEFKRKGNWKNAPGSQAATKKKTPVGMGAKPMAKPAKPTAKPKIGAGAKPKTKPESVKAKGYKRTGKVAPEPDKHSKRWVRDLRKNAKGGGFIVNPEGRSPLKRAGLARSSTLRKAASTRLSMTILNDKTKRAKSKKPQNRSGSTGPEPSMAPKSEVKEPTRSLSPKAQPSSLRLGVRGMSKLSPAARAAFARSRSSMDARDGALAIKSSRKTKKPKPQSRSGEMVLGGGPKTGQMSKWNKIQERKRKR